MPTRILFLFLLITSIIHLNVPAAAQRSNLDGVQRGGRVALVIGNSAYQEGRLSQALDDAQLMASTLSSLGFRVISKYNRTKKQTIEDIDIFRNSINRGTSIAFFYYSGHAMQVDGENYLIPIGADIRFASDLQFEAVHMKRLVATINFGGAKMGIGVLDACRNNPFRGLFRSRERGLTGISAPSGTLIAYATAPNDVASDTGLYAQSLAKFLRQPNLPVVNIFQNVAAEVAQATEYRQIPWFQSSVLTNEVLLKRVSQSSINPQISLRSVPPSTNNTSLENPFDTAHTIYFDRNDPNLTWRARQEVTKWANFLIHNPQVQFLGTAHTDTRGEEGYNLDLSVKFAKAVQDLLLAAGVPQEQILLAAVGESDPAVLGDSDEAHNLNRRFEARFRQ